MVDTRALLDHCAHAATRELCEAYIREQCVPQYETFKKRDPEGKGEYVLRPEGRTPMPAGMSVNTCARMARRVAKSIGAPERKETAASAQTPHDPCAGSKQPGECSAFVDQCRRQDGATSYTLVIKGGREFTVGGSRASCERFARRLARRYHAADVRVAQDETVVDQPEGAASPDLTQNNFFERAQAKATGFGITGDEVLDPDWAGTHSSSWDVVPQPRGRGIVKSVTLGQKTLGCLVRTSDRKEYTGSKKIWQSLQGFEEEKSDLMLKYADLIDPLLQRFFVVAKRVDEKAFGKLRKKQVRGQVLYMRRTVREGMEVERVFLVARGKKAVQLMQQINALKQFRDAELNAKRTLLLGMFRDLGLTPIGVDGAADFSLKNMGENEQVLP